MAPAVVASTSGQNPIAPAGTSAPNATMVAVPGTTAPKPGKDSAAASKNASA